MTLTASCAIRGIEADAAAERTRDVLGRRRATGGSTHSIMKLSGIRARRTTLLPELTAHIPVACLSPKFLRFVVGLV